MGPNRTSCKFILKHFLEWYSYILIFNESILWGVNMILPGTMSARWQKLSARICPAQTQIET